MGDGVRSWVRPRKGPTVSSRRWQPTEKKSPARLRNPGGVDARGRHNPDAIPSNNVTLAEDCTTPPGSLLCLDPVLVFRRLAPTATQVVGQSQFFLGMFPPVIPAKAGIRIGESTLQPGFPLARE